MDGYLWIVYQHYSDGQTSIIGAHETYAAARKQAEEIGADFDPVQKMY